MTQAPDNSGGNDTVEEATDRVDFIVNSVMLPIVLVAGISGGVLNIIVLWKSDKLRGTSYTYLRWMSITDLAVLIVKSVQVTFTRFPAESRPLSTVRFYAHGYLLLINSFVCMSSLLVAVVSIERYFSICQPLRFQFLHTRKTARVAIVAVVIVSVIIHIPHTFDKYVAKHVSPTTNATYYTREWNQSVRNDVIYAYVWPVVRQFFYSFLPIVCLLCLNPPIILAHRRSLAQRRRMRAKQTTDEASHAREQRRMFVMLLCVSVVFLVCMTPQAILAILISSVSVSFINSLEFFTFRMIAHLFEKVNSAANFYAYSLASGAFRQSFREVFPFCFRSRVQPGSSSVRASTD
ncbi:PREDICTED: probable G-protein coupled receptor AH9.1 [Priapulus caudatus]|uniref:Probable G-protein coupled receptor AH9.1 n=1 Tax=Priapulus caudatus TaxID=37621 RepID=A0ABM1EJY8_PRICU|nr:PREDICTED: probable G-protein coupled receptor AH9.1 [Priapulus caudatus]